jgi:phosphatidylglycerophosphatase A
MGGAGMSPVGPGTAGSLATCVLLILVYRFAGFSFWIWNFILFALVVSFSLAAVMLGDWAIGFYGRKDPGAFVLDEAGGICLTMLLLPVYVEWREGVAIGAAFVAFRIFDIAKPWPCRKLETLPAGWGILMDDLMAGVYANVLCQIALRIGERIV